MIRDDGSFELQYAVDGVYTGREYVGAHSLSDGLFRFDFHGSSEATGEVQGNSLLVEYDIIMALSDFVGGLYTRSPE